MSWKGLMEQDLSKLDVTKRYLHLISAYITSYMEYTIGPVAHGKSTVVKTISAVQTVRFKNELERNIKIKLGYANAKKSAVLDPRTIRLMEVEKKTVPCVMSLVLRTAKLNC